MADICGKPMVWWVYNKVKKVSKIDEVYVATDDKRIADVCAENNLKFIMTSSQHNTSTERINEVASKISADVYVCINGDEPLISPDTIAKIIPHCNCGFYVANLMSVVNDPVEVIDNTNIKVVTDCNDVALYMSRSPIPNPKAYLKFKYRKHLGVIAYTKEALEFFVKTPKGHNELIEDINELRFIENGKRLQMIEVESKSISVDTPKDLEKVRQMIIDGGTINED